MPYCGNCKQHHNSVQDVKDCYFKTRQDGDARPPVVHDTRPMTERQREYIESLSEKVELPGNPAGQDATFLKRFNTVRSERETITNAMAPTFVSVTEASELISWLKNLPRTKPSFEIPAIPAGKYALVLPHDARVAFYDVKQPKSGKWVGHTFVDQLFGSPGQWQRLRVVGELARDTVQAIAKDPEGAARRFGQKAGICGRCSSPLSDVRSRAAGYGQHCASILGWWYPSEKEARSMLHEEVGG